MIVVRPRFLACAVVLIAYLGASRAGFIWDDAGLVLANATLDVPSVEAVFGRDLWCCSGTTRSPYYRPLMTLSLVLDRFLFDRDPVGPHMHSLAWHLAATALLGTLLASRLGEARAALGALVFGLHPISSEAVVWISARNDLLVAAFVLATLLAVERDRPLATFVCAALACLSKESGYLLPAIVATWCLAWRVRIGVRCGTAVLVGVAVVFFARSLADLWETASSLPIPPVQPVGIVVVLARYLGWLVFPWPLTSTVTLFATPLSVSAWLAAGLAATGLVFVGRQRTGAWLLLFAGLTLAPAFSGILTFGTLGERYLYLPMVGLAAAAACSLPTSRVSQIAVLGWCAASAVALQARLPEWRSNSAFFTAGATRAPDAYSLALVGSFVFHSGEERRGHLALEAALLALPHHVLACRYIAETGRAILTPEGLADRAGPWLASGCGTVTGFADELGIGLARGGQWSALQELVDSGAVEDESGRLDLARGLILVREGDLLGVGGLAAQSHLGAGEYTARLHPLAQESWELAGLGSGL